jgi:DNA-binding NarL/FixJ family response regulator
MRFFFASGLRDCLTGQLRESIPLPKPTVLVADDHSLMLATVVPYLEQALDVVGTVNNGRDLITEATRLRPDLIVLAIRLPEVNGIEAVHQLRESGSTSKVIFLTVHSDSEFVDACLAEGAFGYVTKSSMGSDLVAAIQEALAGRTFVSPTIAR